MAYDFILMMAMIPVFFPGIVCMNWDKILKKYGVATLKNCSNTIYSEVKVIKYVLGK